MERFSVITSCWGGAAVGEEAELISSLPQTTDELETAIEVRLTGKTTHWTPKLQAISEDSPISSYVDIAGVFRRTADSDIKKRRLKIKPKTRSAAATPPCHGKSATRKPSINVVMPAFSPTPFLF